MRTRTKKPRGSGVVELDVVGIARLGAPPAELPGILAAVLVMDACEGGRVDVALPGEQAEAVASEMVAMIEEGRATGSVVVRPWRLGWHRVTAELAEGRTGR